MSWFVKADDLKYPHDGPELFHETQYFKGTPFIAENPELDSGSPVTVAAVEELKERDVVKHDRYGMGVVANITPSLIVVQFGERGYVTFDRKTADVELKKQATTGGTDISPTDYPATTVMEKSEIMPEEGKQPRPGAPINNPPVSEDVIVDRNVWGSTKDASAGITMDKLAIRDRFYFEEMPDQIYQIVGYDPMKNRIQFGDAASEMVVAKHEYAISLDDAKSRKVQKVPLVHAAQKDISKPFFEFDRIVLSESDPDLDFEGTILEINDKKFPDIDIIVLWDTPLHGAEMSEVHPQEVLHTGKEITKDQMEKASEAKLMLGKEHEVYEEGLDHKIMDKVEEHDGKTEEKFKQNVQEFEEIEAVRKEASKIVLSSFIDGLEGSLDNLASNVQDHLIFYEMDFTRPNIESMVETVMIDTMPGFITASVKCGIAEHEFISEVVNMVEATLMKNAVIKKTPDKEEWCVFSEKGKKFGCYPSRAGAEKRIQQMEMHKSLKGK
jgi:hypothetical protein